MANKFNRFVILIAILIGAVFTVANADDTEIYTNNTAAVGGTPLVMFTLDYRSNVLGSTVCNGSDCDTLVTEGYLASTSGVTRLDYLKAVLKKVLDPLSGMKVGIMMSHANNNNCAGPSDTRCSGGGFILHGLHDITSADSNTDNQKSAIADTLDALNTSGGNTSHPYQGKELFYEFFRYVTGQGAYSGHLGFNDFGDNNQNTNLDSDIPSVQRMLTKTFADASSYTVESDADGDYDTPGTYVSPVTEDCQKIFTINFAFGVTQNEDDADSDITESKANGGLAGITLQGQSDRLETVLSYLYNVDFADNTWGSLGDLEGKQNITSFFVMDSSGMNTGNSWASAGGSNAAYEWSDNSDELVEDLNSMFSQILSVSTTFTAASVPVSVLNRAQVIDNVYIALFRADQDGKKRWPGNVKRLRLDTDAGTLKDSTGANAVGTDGRILHNALTHWTDTSTLPAADTANDEVAGKDGRAVARGGAGQQVPGFDSGNPGLSNPGSPSETARTLYYYDGSGLAALNANSTVATALQTDLGAADATEAEELIQFARGLDVDDEDGDSDTTSEPREWILSDPLHSRPLPINYGNTGSPHTDADPDIRLVFGSNDGFFHMIQNSAGTTDKGFENWAFMPREVMGIQPELRANPMSSDHPYGVDGAPAAYIYDDNNNGVLGDDTDDKVWVFFGLRRGGRGYYAMDITDPDNPVFLWKITESTTGFSELGYTFAQPRVATMRWNDGSGNVTKPVVVFSAGYDTNKDTTSTDDSMGRGIYVVDAQTGALVWKAVNGGSTGSVSSTEYNHADLDDSIPSTLTLVDTNGDENADRAYVGDTGGRIWRFDMEGTDRTAWTATALANIGRHYSNATGNDRRFYHRPDFIQFRDSTGDYDAVVMASGNRAHPLDTTEVDWIYMIKDRNINSGSPSGSTYSQTSFFDATSNCLQDSSCTGSTSALDNGWKVELESSGEKSLATPTTLAKKIYVTTYLPPGSGNNGSCEPDEGSGRLYTLGLSDATAVNDYYVENGDTLEKEDRYTDLKSGGIPAEVVYVPFDKVLKPDLSIDDVDTTGRWKTYWYKKED